MNERRQIVRSSVSPAAIAELRSIKYGTLLEALTAPQIGRAFSIWLQQVAMKVAKDWPKRSGLSSVDISGSAHASYGLTLSSIKGYFDVSIPIAANEYGTGVITPKNSQMLAIPILDGLYPDRTPKRLGPNSWRPLGTFVYRSKRTGQAYIAYKDGSDRLKIIYVLVPRTQGLRAIRKFRDAYDLLLPELYAAITLIMSDAVAVIYNNMFLDSLASIDERFIMQRLPSVVNVVATQAAQLAPRY